ncbi:MAG: shikimate dehydrogenase [Dehalococcoidia bacterium]|nr:shikimate dehydrogenase [Dehalococcoidia bacterium]
MTGFELNGRKLVCGVMGDPVEHSVSPAMHNAAFRKLGLNYVYLPFRVSRDRLASAVEGIRALHMAGMNITIPHKVSIIPLLDEVDPLAQRIGAVNVVHNKDGRLTGGNTDAEGFLRLLKEQGIETHSLHAVVLGAGGASRAVCFALASLGSDITILNRTLQKARDCAEDMAKYTGRTFAALELNPDNLTKSLARADLLVNATSLGMAPHAGESPVNGKLLERRHIVVDIVYNPVVTRLLRDAEKAGARIIGGLNMLAWQGALSFEIWTGCRAPVDVMRRAAVQAMKRYAK